MPAALDLTSLADPTSLLYLVCCALLIGMAGFVWAKAPRSWLHHCFALTALSLLVWLVTLFLFGRAHDPDLVLWLGRANFAAVVFAAYLGYRLVLAVAERPVRASRWRLAETLLLGVLSALTPLVDRAEIVGTDGQHTTVFGPLFPVYIVHVVVYLGAAIWTAFRARKRASGLQRAKRDQLLLLGAGMLATGSIALVTNAVLPYLFGNFDFIHVGTLSTILFLLAVAYAIVRHHLFDVRLLIRRTLVYGVLLSFVVAAYSAVVILVADSLAGPGADIFTRFGVLVIASAFDPLRRFLDKRVDRLLFRGEVRHHHRRSRV
jgi:hypothetical protein